MLKDHCLSAGADALVVKSGEFDELTSALRQAARAAGARAAAPDMPGGGRLSADG